MIKLLTYNVKMLPGVAGAGSGDLNRAAAITNAVGAMDPDIICLQEVFDEDARDVFVQNLRPRYPHQVPKSSTTDLSPEDSGLFFASKLPIKWHGFEEFEDAEPGTFDAASDKGIFGARIDVSARLQAIKYLHVFNTHLQATEAYHATRAKQLTQARHFMVKVLTGVHDTAHAGAVLVGDLNILAEVLIAEALHPTAEYRSMVSRLGYPRDLYRDLHDCEPGYTWDPVFNEMIPRNDKDRQRIDYALAFDEIPAGDDNARPPPIGRFECSHVAIVRFGATPATCLSDHFGVELTIA
jgi:endonuclease/exonuclease/phosphatase family metal-dependent hydrolase